MNPLRQSGRTTRQILEAPRGAVFVWCNENVHYAERLCRHLQREDLRVISAHTATSHGYWDGRREDIVIDHAFFEILEDMLIERLMDVVRKVKQ